MTATPSLGLRVGLNPYGIAYTIGLHGKDTPRANPRALGLSGYLDLAESIGARCVELPTALLAAFSDDDLRRLRDRLDFANRVPVLSQGSPVGGIEASLTAARALGATIIRMALTRVLCGDRADPSCNWTETVTSVEKALRKEGVVAADRGVTLGIENHQDFTSAELMEFCEASGPNVGITFDVGNALAVGEDPIAFTRTIAPRVCHVHLKDYRAHWTEEGYRLVRCAIGDGALPFKEIAVILSEHTPGLTAAIEPGALNVRYIRLLTPDWWEGYPDRSARALVAGLAAARVRQLGKDDDWRTPWEQEAEPDAVVRYEMAMLEKSVANLKEMGLM